MVFFKNSSVYLVTLSLLVIVTVSLAQSSMYEPKPEINHIFREPEKRPPSFVSDAFTVVILGTFVLLLGLWVKIGVNVSNFSFSLSALGFHSGLALIFGLFFVSWLQMDMFQTLKCLSGIALLTFLSGHSLLKDMSKKRTAALMQ